MHHCHTCKNERLSKITEEMEQKWQSKRGDKDAQKVHIVLVVVQMEFLQFFHRLPISYY